MGICRSGIQKFCVCIYIYIYVKVVRSLDLQGFRAKKVQVVLWGLGLAEVGDVSLVFQVWGSERMLGFEVFGVEGFVDLEFEVLCCGRVYRVQDARVLYV